MKSIHEQLIHIITAQLNVYTCSSLRVSWCKAMVESHLMDHVYFSALKPLDRDKSKPAKTNYTKLRMKNQNCISSDSCQSVLHITVKLFKCFHHFKREWDITHHNGCAVLFICKSRNSVQQIRTTCWGRQAFDVIHAGNLANSIRPYLLWGNIHEYAHASAITLSCFSIMFELLTHLPL